MSAPITVEVTGKDSSSRVTARADAAQKLVRELNRRGLMHVTDVRYDVQFVLHGRFKATASIKAVPR